MPLSFSSCVSSSPLAGHAGSLGYRSSGKMGRREIRRALDSGKKWPRREVVAWTCLVDPGRPYPRLGVIVGRRLGGAVRRNRIKRLIREVFRLNKSSLANGADVVIYPRSGCGWENFRQAEQALLNIWKRAGIFQTSVS